jgi:hypothetical protein
MMTQLIPANIPMYIQCLRVPVEWRRSDKRAEVLSRYPATVKLSSLINARAAQPESDLLEARMTKIEAVSFDPWEKRNEFFRLQRGDTDALMEFLSTVGVFGRIPLMDRATENSMAQFGDAQPYQVSYWPTISATEIWEYRRMLEGSLRTRSEIGGYADFHVRLVRIKGTPRTILTTTTFLDSLLLTLAHDRVLNAKVRKCARPDCGVTFSTTSGHEQKYCEWYCGHIESVRRQRRTAKRTAAKRTKAKQIGR